MKHNFFHSSTKVWDVDPLSVDLPITAFQVLQYFTGTERNQHKDAEPDEQSQPI